MPHINVYVGTVQRSNMRRRTRKTTLCRCCESATQTGASLTAAAAATVATTAATDLPTNLNIQQPFVLVERLPPLISQVPRKASNSKGRSRKQALPKSYDRFSNIEHGEYTKFATNITKNQDANSTIGSVAASVAATSRIKPGPMCYKRRKMAAIEEEMSTVCTPVQRAEPVIQLQEPSVCTPSNTLRISSLGHDTEPPPPLEVGHFQSIIGSQEEVLLLTDTSVHRSQNTELCITTMANPATGETHFSGCTFSNANGTASTQTSPLNCNRRGRRQYAGTESNMPSDANAAGSGRTTGSPCHRCYIIKQYNITANTVNIS